MLHAPWISIFKETYTQWAAHKASRLAAALSYYTIFSLAPLLLIVIAIAGLVFGAQAAHGQITGALGGILGAKSAHQVDTMIAAAGSHKSGVIATSIGVVMLVLGASGVVLQLQDALNTVWDVQLQSGGGFLRMIRERLISFSMILGLAFLLLVSLVVSAGLSALNTYTTSIAPALNYTVHALNVVLDLGILTLLFAVIYKFLPEAEVHWRDVWMGSFITGLLFTIGQFALTIYLGKMNVASPYGDAGSIIVLLLWVYYSAQLLLFGAEFTRVWALRVNNDSVSGVSQRRALKGTLDPNDARAGKTIM